MFSVSPDSTQRTLLAEALQLSRYLLHTAEADDATLHHRQERLRQIREALKAFAHPICHTALPVAAIPLEVRQTFVRAVLLTTRYRQLGGDGWQGTLTSPTLSQYLSDPIPDKLLTEPAIEALSQKFELPASARTNLEVAVQSVDRHIAQQQQVIQTMLMLAQTNDSATTTPHVLFQHLFSIPIPAAAIDVVYTNMQFFFCIDFQNEQLSDEALWQSLPAVEQLQIQEFLRSLKQFSFAQFQRFPVFGPCAPERIDPAWCAQLAQSVGVEPPEVIRALTRSIGIIPTQKAEAFLVHDIWGHHWQLMLTQFESDYAILTTCDEPLRAAETAYTSKGPLSCRELFVVESQQVRVDEVRARLFFHGEVQQRLGLLFTHLIGEMTADVAEFKFVWQSPQLADQLLSSSLFKSEPTKLDLGLADIDFLFLKVLRPLLEVHLSVFEECVLETELLMDWQTAHPVNSLELRTSLKQAIAQLYRIFLEEYNNTYLPTMTGESGMFTQIVSNLLYLQNAINSLYTLTPEASAGLPFQDLLLVFIGCYCSSDSFAEFWAIDDVLAGYFLPCWQVLRSWLEN